MGFHYLIQDAPITPGSMGERMAAICALHNGSSIKALPNDLIPIENANLNGDRLFIMPCPDFTIYIGAAGFSEDDIEFLHVGSMEHVSTPHSPYYKPISTAIIAAFSYLSNVIPQFHHKCASCRSSGPEGSICGVCCMTRESTLLTIY